MEDEVEYAKRRSKRNRKRCIIGLSILLVLLLIIAIIVIVILVVVPLFRHQQENGEFRLPTSISPNQYALELQPYLTPGNFTFDGNINITVKCLSSTDNITLHSSNLTIHEATVKDLTGGSHPTVKKIELVPKYELLILHLKNELTAGTMYQLHIEFSGTLGTSKGFYWRSYTNEYNQKKYVAATKFKPTYARRAFPCFDEPAFKSTFTITIVRQDDVSSLSSGGSKKTKQREDGWKADVYSPSVTMSTYLVAFFIGDYTSTRISKNNVSIVAKVRSIKDAEYALDAAQNASEFYSSKIKIPFRIPKLDLVAIPDEIDGEKKKPHKFDALGQESTSWGLVMMDESSMLSMPQAEEWEKQDVARKVAHQVAHQMFGALVTPKWWSDMWLSESLATYLAIQAADNKIHPKWKTLEALKRSSDYVEFDCSELSHPLSIAVDNPSDISKIFNHALYKKGARLINMVHGLLENKLFWQGLLTFLQNTFSVADSDDLWRSLTRTQKDDDGKIDFEEVMKSWMHNRGHPIVTLKRNYHQKTALLSQTSCLNESTLWQIPITYLDRKNARNEPVLLWFNSTEKKMYTMPDKDDWVLLNGELNGYFHVNYDSENWKMLAQQLQDDHDKIFSPSTRYQLLYDALLLSRMNITSYDILFELLVYMKFENDLGVKEFLAEAKLSEIWKMLRMSKVDSKWKDYLLRVIGDTYRDLFPNDSGREELELLPKIYLKREIATCSCYYNKHTCVKDAIEKSKKWLSEKEPFKEVTTSDHYLIKPYLCTAVHKENAIADKIYDCLRNKDTTYDYLENKTETKDMIYALGCNTDTHRSSIYIDHFINDVGDPEMIIESMLNSHNSSLFLFDYLKSNIIRLKNNHVRLELIVKRLSEAVANPLELDKMSEVFDTFIKEMKKEDNKKETQRITNMIYSYVEKAKKRLDLVKYQLPSMVHWLRNYQYSK